MQRVSIFGTGYVGLVTAACMASRGIEVVCYDVDRSRLAAIAEGRAPFYEPGLDELLTKSVSEGRLRVSHNPNEAVTWTDCTIVTVGTPSREDGSVDLSQVLSACEAIGKALKEKGGHHVVAIKSTVPPGTTGRAVKEVLEKASGKRCGEGFSLCANPEFLREGNAVEDTFNADRVVIGEVNEGSAKSMLTLYEEFYGNSMPEVLITSAVNAELIKYVNNAFLAMKVSAINMVANLCQVIPGADVEVVAKGIGMDRRIGPHFLKAGLGWGGSCWPKDLAALKKFAAELGVEMPLVDATIAVNERQPLKAVELAERELGTLKGAKVAVLGLAFKAGTDDVRGAVSIRLVKSLLERGAEVTVYDPAAIKNAVKLLGESVKYASSAFECIEGKDCCVVATEWEEFKKIRVEDFASRMRRPILIDGRRLYSPSEFSGRVKYLAIGLGP